MPRQGDGEVARTPATITLLRGALDAVDDGIVVLSGVRARVVQRLAAAKRAAAWPACDPAREAAVRTRARRLALRVGADPATAEALMAILIDEASMRQQAASTRSSDVPGWGDRLLHLLPPPRRLAPVLRALPPGVQHALLRTAVDAALAGLRDDDALAPLYDRRIGVRVRDLGLGWVFTVRAHVIDVDAGLGSAEACIDGNATDLLRLASRLEDADALFFDRRLSMTGDVDLGLTARNLLDRIPWESVPLGLRIALHRCARIASRARALANAS